MTSERRCFLLWAKAQGWKTGAIKKQLHCHEHTIQAYIRAARRDITTFADAEWVVRREEKGRVSWVCMYCASLFDAQYLETALLHAWRHLFDPSMKLDKESETERADLWAKYGHLLPINQP